MSEQGYFTNQCQSCSGGIEFPVSGVGEQIECPHCHTQLTLMFPSGSDCDPVEQIEVFLKTSLFPTKRAELLLLTNYSFPTEANNPPQLEMWRNALKDDPANVLDRFLSERFLQEADLDPTVLLQSKSSNDLKAMAKERGLAFSGTKQALAKRLTKADPGGMAQLFRCKVYLTCSPKGQILVERFRQAEKLMQERAEKKTFELLENGELKEACVAVAAYEASRAFPRGVGMDWGKYDCRHDINVLQIIFTARLSRQACFDENTMTKLRPAAAMMHLWGTNDPSQWLPVGGEDEQPDLVMEARMLLFHALDRIRLQEMKEAGIRRVKILAPGNNDDCPICREDEGKAYPIDRAPSLPHEGCTCECGCRCITIATE